MRWEFRPHQKEIRLVPGETALAFYTARNPSDRPVTGIATYNVIPFEAGLYFNKIQCFCFEEQRLNPREQVGTSSLDLSVFFNTCKRNQECLVWCDGYISTIISSLIPRLPDLFQCTREKEGEPGIQCHMSDVSPPPPVYKGRKGGGS